MYTYVCIHMYIYIHTFTYIYKATSHLPATAWSALCRSSITIPDVRASALIRNFRNAKRNDFGNSCLESWKISGDGWQETLSPQVRYVLDFGIVRKMVFDEERAMQSARPGDWEHDMPLARQSPGDSLTWFSQKKHQDLKDSEIFSEFQSCHVNVFYITPDMMDFRRGHRLSFVSRSLCNTWSSQATCRQRAAGLFLSAEPGWKVENSHVMRYFRIR